MVANSFCDMPRRRVMIWSLVWFSSSISLWSDGVSEKKAISEADTKPEQKSKRQANTSATTTPAEGAVN